MIRDPQFVTPLYDPRSTIVAFLLLLNSRQTMSLIFDKSSFLSKLKKENDYEAQQISKEQTKILRFKMEGPRPCIFCFAPLLST